MIHVAHGRIGPLALLGATERHYLLVCLLLVHVFASYAKVEETEKWPSCPCPGVDWTPPGFDSEQRKKEYHLKRCPVGRIDVRRKTVDGQLTVNASDEFADVLWQTGRTEDIVVSPDGQLLIVVGFRKHSLTFLKVNTDADRSTVEITDASTTGEYHPALVSPHGLAFLDDHTLVIANRDGPVVLAELDRNRTSLASWRLLVDKTSSVPAIFPGNVFTRPLFGSLVEVFVCNNYPDGEVMRYVLDKANRWKIKHAEKILDGISFPDGIAITSSGEWIAVSNNVDRQIHIFEYTRELGPHSNATRVLKVDGHPHGLQFTPDDSTLLVADAGTPHMHAFHSSSADWGEDAYISKSSTQIMDDATFFAGHESPSEGGPKGVTIFDQDIVAVTSHFQPLAFFRLEHFTSKLLSKSANASDNIADIRGHRFNEEDRFVHRLMKEVSDLHLHLREAEIKLAEYRDESETMKAQMGGMADQMRQFKRLLENML